MRKEELEELEELEEIKEENKEIKKKTKNDDVKNYFARITYYRTQQNMKFSELAKEVHLSTYWLRKQLKAGNGVIFRKCLKVLGQII